MTTPRGIEKRNAIFRGFRGAWKMPHPPKQEDAERERRAQIYAERYKRGEELFPEGDKWRDETTDE